MIRSAARLALLLVHVVPVGVIVYLIYWPVRERHGWLIAVLLFLGTVVLPLVWALVLVWAYKAWNA